MAGRVAKETLWYGFDDYDCDDQILQPADGAELFKYSPWEEYRRSRERGSEPPYKALLELADKLDEAKATRSGEAMVAACLAFCSEYGLLGSEMDDSLIGLLSFDNEANIKRNLSRYGEPLGGFIFQVRTFRDALMNAQAPKSRRPRKKSWEWINYLARGTSVCVVPEKSGYVEERRSGTLLGAFAAMAQIDLLGGKRFLRCEGCGSVKFTQKPHTRHCSPTCRFRTQQRRRRKRRHSSGKRTG